VRYIRSYQTSDPPISGGLLMPETFLKELVTGHNLQCIVEEVGLVIGCSQHRTLPLHPVWREIYLSRPRAIDPSGFVFTNKKGKPYSTKWMWRSWREACDAAGVHGLTLYAGTRHSLASQAANRGVSIYMIAKFLGHNDIKTSQRYAHLETNPMRQVQRRGSVTALSVNRQYSEK
jgi:integrase